MLDRAVQAGRLDGVVADRWWARQQALDAAGRFRAAWAKVLVVAARPRPRRSAPGAGRRPAPAWGHA